MPLLPLFSWLVFKIFSISDFFNDPTAELAYIKVINAMIFLKQKMTNID